MPPTTPPLSTPPAQRKKWPLALSVLIMLGLAGGAGYYVIHQQTAPQLVGESSGQGEPTPSTPVALGEFSDNRLVVIEGYSGNAEEPFLTPDGEYLLFDDRSNGTNIPKIYYAKRVNDATFTFMGEVQGVNNASSPSIMAIMDDHNNFYFNSPRPPDPKSAIYRGLWHSNGTVTDVAPVPGLAAKAEQGAKLISSISRDGQTLYFGYGDLQGKDYIGIALQNPDGTFTELTDASSDTRMLKWKDEFKNIYGMYYGGKSGTRFRGPFMTTPDGLEAYFEQINSVVSGWPPQLNQLYVAKRTSTSEPFGPPQVVAGQAALANGKPGFNEWAFVSRDGNLLYYHHLDLVEGQDPHNARFSIYVMSR